MDEARPWAPLGAVSAATLTETRLQAHHAVQLLAAFGQAMAEPVDDDSHRATTWHPDQSALQSSPARGNARHFARLSLLTLELSHHRGPEVEALPLEGVSLERAFEWLSARADAALGPQEYDLPDHGVLTGEPFRPHGGALLELSRWFGNAHGVLDALRQAHPGTSALRCWPHHFDLAALLTLPESDPEGRSRTVGLGFSPGDEGSPEPYGYVTPWPYPWDAPRPSLPSGHWHVEGWLGAVLPAEAWSGSGDATSQQARVMDFYRAALGAALAMHQG